MEEDSPLFTTKEVFYKPKSEKTFKRENYNELISVEAPGHESVSMTAVIPSIFKSKAATLGMREQKIYLFKK